jgi:hypothetical protein
MKGLGAAVILLGALSSANFFDAASRLQRSGNELTQLRSQGGTTVAEAYYQETGRLAVGQGSAAYGMGLAVLAISLGFGGSMIAKK